MVFIVKSLQLSMLHSLPLLWHMITKLQMKNSENRNYFYETGSKQKINLLKQEYSRQQMKIEPVKSDNKKLKSKSNAIGTQLLVWRHTVGEIICCFMAYVSQIMNPIFFVPYPFTHSWLIKCK